MAVKHRVVDGVCQFYDLPVKMCADCQGHTSVEEQAAQTMRPITRHNRNVDGPVFAARFASRCPACGFDIHEQEEIFFSAEHDAYIHKDCA